MQDRTAEFEAYWESLRDGLMVPPKSSIEPTRIPNLLPRISILERHRPDRFIYRLVGTAIAAEGASDQTGRSVLDFLPAEMHQRAINDFAVAIEKPCGYRVTTFFTTAKGRELERRVTFLPLGDDDGETRFLFGYYHAKDDPDQPDPMPINHDPVVVALTRADKAEYIDIGAGPAGLTE